MKATNSMNLTPEECSNIRAALNFLRIRCGGWNQLAKIFHVSRQTAKIPTPILAFRIARVAKVGVDDVLRGRFPEPGTCAHCGHRERAAT